MKLTAEIRDDRTIKVEVDTECSDITIKEIRLYTCKSLKECEPFYTDPIDDGSSFCIKILHENDMNCFASARYSDKFDDVDLLNDLIIIEAEVRYPENYELTHSCKEMQSCINIGTYYKCRIYTRIMNALASVESDCSNLMTSTFVDEVLKKKMIDTCLEAKEFSKACQLWYKFYSTSKFTTKGGCGCGRS